MINLLFPKKCKICLKDLDYGFLCTNCELEFRVKLKLKFINPKNSLDGLFYLIDLDPKVRKILHLGKYRFAKAVWKFFGNVLKEEFKDRKLAVTYVPMNWFRFCFRGFNQSFMLARYLGKPVKLVYKNWLVHSVTNLNKKDRAKELEKAFIIKNSAKENIIIVDDVYTTGATMNQIAKTIKSKNPRVKVYGLVIAKTPLKWRGS